MTQKTSVAVGALLVLGACSGTLRAASPEEALASFARALREGDIEVAYALTSEAYRRRVSRDQFERWVRQNPAEIQRVAEALEHPAGPAEVEATVEISPHERIRMVRDPGGWRIATDVVDYYGQRTPQQALRSFVRAVEQRRWDVVLRLVPEADREGMSPESLRERWEGEGREEIERLAAGIRAALDAGTPIEVSGDHAVMPWGDRHRAQLAREGAGWTIADPD